MAIRCAWLAEYQSDRFRGYGGAPRLVLRRQSTSVATCRHYVRSIARQALTCSSQRGWPGSRARNISSPQASPGGAGVPGSPRFCEDLGPTTWQRSSDRLRANSHLQNVCIVDAHRPCLSAEIPTETAPAPLRGRLHQSTLNRIAVHVA